MINIFVIDSYTVFRHGLVSILEGHPEFRVTGDSVNITEALAKLSDNQPDVVIIDICIPGDDGIEAITLLRHKFPSIKVIILTASSNEDKVFKAIRAGARGYLLKSVEPVELIEAVRLVANGDAMVFPFTAFGLDNVFGGETGRRDKLRVDGLSPREKEVLWLVVQGSSNKEIAAHCYVSETTAKAHIRRILEKLKVKNRVQAAALAIKQNLVSQT